MSDSDNLISPAASPPSDHENANLAPTPSYSDDQSVNQSPNSVPKYENPEDYEQEDGFEFDDYDDYDEYADLIEEYESVGCTNDQPSHVMSGLDTNYDKNSSSEKATADFKAMKSSTENSDASSSQQVHCSRDVPMTDVTNSDADKGAEVVVYNKEKFMQFLAKYATEQIDKMIEDNGCSVEVDCKHFVEESYNVAEWIRREPELVQKDLGIFILKGNPHYKHIHQEFFLRIKNYGPVYHIHSLRQIHLNTMIRVRGVVARRTVVLPQLLEVTYNCHKCGGLTGPIHQNSSSEVKVANCSECKRKGPFSVNIEKTLYRNYQTLTLQESLGIVPAGRVPRYKEVILLNDLIDCAHPGEEIEITGVYTTIDSNLNAKFGIPLFPTVIEANYVGKDTGNFSSYNLTQKDKEEIWKLSKHPQIAQRIFKSIAPSIYGHEDIKTAIALAMFGGQEKFCDERKTRLRGDIHVLLLGDPGTAKSQLLKFVEKTSDKAVYATGKGSSAVGLTVAVRMDPATRQWNLDIGALALADRGICLIDEIDAMSSRDKGILHEAMEQQTISISKAGIVTSLQARCAVIAAASPIGGRYNPLRSAMENANLTNSLMSRFDLLCVIKDKVDAKSDDLLGNFVVDSHLNSQPKKDSTNAYPGDDATFTMAATDAYSGDDANSTMAATDPEIIPQDLLKKYVRFAKLTAFPKLADKKLVEKLENVYPDLRRSSSVLTTRHLEAMIRMSEAHAKMHLRQSVTEEDVNMAVNIFLKSFVSTLPSSEQEVLKRKLKNFTTSEKDFFPLILHHLRDLADAERLAGTIFSPSSDLPYVQVNVQSLIEKLREYDFTTLEAFFSSKEFAEAGFVHIAKDGVIKHHLLPDP